MIENNEFKLSQDAETLRSRTLGTLPGNFDCEVLIIGSGYGGAVAAARLAGATVADADQHAPPLRIWLLERGAEYRLGSFPSRFAELPGHVRFSMQDGEPARGRAQGLLDFRIGSDVSVLLGNGLGGGSLINANVMERPESAVLASGWPREFNKTALDEAYERAEAMLAAHPLPDNIDLGKLRALRGLAASDKRGSDATRCPVSVHWKKELSTAKVQMQQCTLCGDCMTGCNQGAKGSLDTNYLAYARARGVEMFTGVAVERIEPLADGGWMVMWHHTEPGLRPLDGAQPVANLLRARRVVLAAGALGSTEILKRSASAGLALSVKLGKRFSMNGDALAAGIGHPKRVGAAASPELDPADIDARRVGPTITGLLRVAATADDPGFVIEEFGVPGALRRSFGEIVATLAKFRDPDAAGDMPGDDPALCSESHIDRMSLYGLMGNDGAAGRLELPAGGKSVEGGLRVDWPNVAKLPLFTRMKDWLEKRQAKAVNVDPESPVIAPPLKFARLFNGIGGALITVHPLGGCAMADDATGGVVDHCARVFNTSGGVHEGLAVLDGAIVPRALGINPALTITALAERALPMLADAWVLTLKENAPAVVTLGQREAKRRRELPPEYAAWLLRECLQGPFERDGRVYWARMELRYEEIPGFNRALQIPERVLIVRSGQLDLHNWPGGQVGIPNMAVFQYPPPDPKPLYTAELAGSLRLFSPMLPADEKERRSTLDYRLSVQGLSGAAGNPLAIGGRLDARKTFGVAASHPTELSALRQLAEAEVRYEGLAVGRWMLDISDLAEQREPLLRLARHSSMPEAIGDALVGAGYLARGSYELLVKANVNIGMPAGDAHPGARFPADITGYRAERYPVRALDPKLPPSGARLTRYQRTTANAAKTPLLPLLLIHGMGASGNSYTLDCLNSDDSPNLLHSAFADKNRQEVWVLDVRSSIGNEWGRQSEASAQWTVESIARQDIPDAIRIVLAATKAAQLDVFAHCMGAVMLWMALLSPHDDESGQPDLAKVIHAAVFSQIAPTLCPTAFNRLRGYLASYLLKYLQVDEVDTCPGFESQVSGPDNASVTWKLGDGNDQRALLTDLLLAQFPYPDDDLSEKEKDEWKKVDWRARHRADAIFGQLFQLANLSPGTVAQLGNLLGWVKLPMLAQAIHFAREQMLTDADGRNVWLDEDNLRARLTFPLLIVHGRVNRVFDWQGSLEGLKLLKRVRCEAEAEATSKISPDVGVHYGAGTPTQLLILEKYGHFDCVIGRYAGRDVFPLALKFLANPPKPCAPFVPPIEQLAEAPGLGPTLGWLRNDTVNDTPYLVQRLWLQAKSRTARTSAVAFVPVRWRGGVPTPQFRNIMVADWAHGFEPGVIDLWFERTTLDALAYSFVVLMLKEPSALVQGIKAHSFLTIGEQGRSVKLPGPDSASRTEIEKRLKEGGRDLIDACQFSLAPHLLDAADCEKLATQAPALNFALGSCQTPADLFDELPAGASYQRLLRDAMRADGPQFLLQVGDQVYLDASGGVFDPPGTATVEASDARRAAREIRHAYELNLQLKPLRRCMARLPVYPMLDDHEVRNDWKGCELEPTLAGVDVGIALDHFERYQHVLAPDRALFPRSPSYSYLVRPAGVPFFVLDTRSQRRAARPGEPASGRILAAGELAALCSALAEADPALPKFIVSPVPLLPPERILHAPVEARLNADSWAGFPASTARLLCFIRDQNIRRVVLLSGDAHLSSVSRFVFDDGNDNNQVIAVLSSGFYAPWPFANQRPDELLLHGPIDMGLPPEQSCVGTLHLEAISTASGYAFLRLQPTSNTAENPRLTVSLRGGNGASVDCDLDLN